MHEEKEDALGGFHNVMGDMCPFIERLQRVEKKCKSGTHKPGGRTGAMFKVFKIKERYGSFNHLYFIYKSGS